MRRLLPRRVDCSLWLSRSLELAIVTVLIAEFATQTAFGAEIAFLPAGLSEPSVSVVLGGMVVFILWAVVISPIRSRSRSNQATSIVETSPDAIITVSASGFIESFNPAATRLFGWPENKAVGKPFQAIIAATDRQRCSQLFDANMPESERVFPRSLGEVHSLRQDGSEFVADASVSMFGSKRRPTIVAVMRDVSYGKESRDMASMLIEASPDAMFVAGQDRVLQRVNRQMEVMFGYSREELIGQPIDRLLPGRDRAINPQQDGGTASHTDARSKDANREPVGLRKNGEQFPAEITLSPMSTKKGLLLIAAIRDATERKTAEKELQRERSLLRTLIDNIPDYIYVKDMEHRFLVANAALAARIGVRASRELIGRTEFNYYPKELAAESARAELATMRSGQAVINREESGQASDGQTIWMLTTEVPFRDESGQVTGLVGIGRDITERKIAEQQLARRAEELASANKKLQQEQAERGKVEAELRLAQKLEAIGQLAAGIAHEINTPMQYIGDSVHFLRQSFTDLLQLADAHEEANRSLAAAAGLDNATVDTSESEDGPDLPYLRDRVPRALERTLEGIERVTSIVGAMKEFAHPFSAEKSATDLNKALGNALLVSRNEYKYVADVETDFTPIPLVLCYPGELNQVFVNLIVNAAHAVGDVVKGTERKGMIRISTAPDEGAVVIRIKDSGTGIPTEIRDRIFDPFFTTKPVGKGTGQGLAIAHSIIVGKHGGALSFESELGQGTTFLIRLPVGQPSSSTKGAVA